MRRDELTLPTPAATDRPGDRWLCGRSGDQLPCSRGPSPNGVCPLAEACRPQQTWHGLSKKIALAALVILVIAVLALTWGRNSARVFKPGDLSTPHAQILAGTLTSQRCASCHPQAATSPGAWFSSADVGHKHVSQTDRCLNCHHTSMDRRTAKLAHNLPLRVRAELRLASAADKNQSWHDLLPGPAVDQENVECSACHREHHGADGDLLAISDSQCQTCHADRFGSFATSHPEWDLWPYGRGRQVSFNHASHAKEHFPATVRGSSVAQFQCVDCHRKTENDELTRSTSYARACKSCHDDALRIESGEGIELLALPTLPAESAAKIMPWPEPATGFYDGKVSPLADLLLRSDRATMSALRQLPDRDFNRIDSRNPEEVRAAEIVAVAHRELLAEIAARGQIAIADRAATMRFTSSTLAPLLRSLSPQLISDANRRWFNVIRQTQFQDISYPPPTILLADRPQDPSLQEDLLSESDVDMSADDSLLTPLDSQSDLLTELPTSNGGDGFEGDDPLTADSSSDRGPGRRSPTFFDAESMMPSGGWYRDDVRLAIRYRGGGHEDPVLKATIEMIAQLAPGDSVRESLLSSRAVSACVACHPGALTSADGWRSSPLIGRKGELTKFSHGPHLNVAQLADCRHCHAIGSHTDTDVHLIRGISNVDDFQPLRREACAACHTPQAAGDSCIKCHRYHVDLR